MMGTRYKNRNYLNRVELHCHTGYSTVEGGAQVKDIVDWAIGQGMMAIAFTDPGNVMAYPEIQFYCDGKKGVKSINGMEGFKPIYGIEGYVVNDTELFGKQRSICSSYPVTILAKNRDGIRTLYRLVTDANLKYGDQGQGIRLSDLLANREHLLIGSGFVDGMLGHAIRSGRSAEDMEAIASIYDFLEVQPTEELRWRLAKDNDAGITSKEDIRAYIDQMVVLGEKLHKPVVATGDVRYFCQENAPGRCGLNADLGVNGSEDSAGLPFRTTEEMLDEFSFLGADKAYEIVVENSNRIAEQTEYIKPLAHEKLSYNREGDYERLEALCYAGLKRVYGEQAALEPATTESVETEPVETEPAEMESVETESAALEPAATEPVEMRNEAGDVRARLKEELEAIRENENAYYYLWLYDLLHDNGLKPIQYNLRGTAASMLVSYLLGLSHVNPMDEEVPLYHEFFQGIHGDKSPDIDMDVDAKVWEKVIETTKKLPGIKTAYHAGSLHFGGMLMIPEGVDELSYAPLALDDERKEVVLSFDEYSLGHIFEKVDVLNHDICTLNSRLYEACGYYPTEEDIRSEEILSLVTNSEGLGIPQGSNHGVKSGLLAIPGLMNEFTMMLVDTLQPKTYAELVRLEGIVQGSNTWPKNGEILFAEGKASIENMIGSREDVFETMMVYGIDRETAFAIAEDVRKGRMCSGESNAIIQGGQELMGLPVKELMGSGKRKQELREVMVAAGVPDWYIWSCEQIGYLSSRAYLTECVQRKLRTLYYKLHYPDVFYPLFLRT